MRITLAQFTCREGDIAHNLAAVLAQIESCSGQTCGQASGETGC